MNQNELPLLEKVLDHAHDLVSSRRVQGTPVCSREREKLGTIHSVMIDKRSGQVAYAVFSFGGFFGIGSYVHPVPWQVLTYDIDREAYVVNLTREELESGPKLSVDCADRPRKRSEDEAMYEYYGVMPPWV